MTLGQLLIAGGALLFAFLCGTWCGTWFGLWIADVEDEEFEAAALKEAAKLSQPPFLHPRSFFP